MTALARIQATGGGSESAGRAVVGKDVLELLSTAMYVEPLSVYREYIQNAADSIEEVRRAGGAAGRVEISFDAATRTVTLRDDGAGVPASDFVRVLTSVGASGKRGTGARGFRGVGRLSGLAYARAVSFSAKAQGEDVISSVTWDCQALRAALRDGDNATDLAGVIEAITSTKSRVVDPVASSFFEVRLEGVARFGDDRMMSPGAVADYLAQIAPISFDPSFSLAEMIVERLRAAGAPPSLEITVDGGAPLTRPFRDEMPVEGGRPVRLRDVSFVEVPSIEGGFAAIAWVAHHDYEGAVNAATLVRGLRARAGDLQVGGADVLADVFPETRFNSWAVGEVHILDPRIVPNGRRDDFERNVHLANLKNHLSPLGRDVAHRCRSSSRERKRLRDLAILLQAAEETLAILAQGSLAAPERDRLALSVELNLMKADRLIAAAESPGEVERGAVRDLADLRARLDELAGDGAEIPSPLDRLPRERRTWYEEMFALIYDCSSNRAVAKALVDRILVSIA